MLFRMSTGESWNGIMHDCFSNATCYPGYEGCGNTTVSVIFFVSFMLIGAFVFLNLFIAVIIENFLGSDDFGCWPPQHRCHRFNAQLENRAKANEGTLCRTTTQAEKCRSCFKMVTTG